ncbi:hypothetical protein ITP53_41060 [Nonomuraea sp. K274]|uniref:Uncharacterized protein n=1 Tax=Nonomuraea cypriaca TaxID=1187855 RepID=A0A931AFG3_9ACTN|nr:hypothetical protein [Nonomuraea cypriaca]MBF8191967.1 hypothetical protein [Nonomuraea cypriaca]
MAAEIAVSAARSVIGAVTCLSVGADLSTVLMFAIVPPLIVGFRWNPASGGEPFPDTATNMYAAVGRKP